MPFKLQKSRGKDLYWVVNKLTKEKYSKDPLPLERAKAQMRALYASENKSSLTHREKFLKNYDLEDKSYSLKQLSKISKVPISILQEVYNRGIGAYKTQGKSIRLQHSYVKNVDAPMSAKLSKEQWAMARVYSFLDGNPKHDNDLRANRGGQVSVEQRLAELNALIPSEEKWNTMKASNPSNPALKDTYAEFRAYKEQINRQRAEALAPTAEKEAVSKAQQEELQTRNEAYQQYYAEHPEEQPIVCNLNEKLERVKEYGVPAAICQARHQEAYRQKMAADPFGRVVQGLTDVADFAAENLTDFLPGIGKIAAEVYKSFAPPTSAFSSQNMLIGQGVAHHVFHRESNEMKGSAKGIIAQLQSLGISPDKYLQANRAIAKKAGYNPKSISLSNKPDKKLMAVSPSGQIIYFGQVGYDDYVLLSLLGKKELAEKKRNAYLVRAKQIKGDWAKDKYSPNSLAIAVLWKD